MTWTSTLFALGNNSVDIEVRVQIVEDPTIYPSRDDYTFDPVVWQERCCTSLETGIRTQQHYNCVELEFDGYLDRCDEILYNSGW